MALPKSIDKLRSNLSAGDVPIIGSQSSVPIQRNHPDSIKSKVDEYIVKSQGVGTSLFHPSDLPIYHMTMKIYDYAGMNFLPGQGYFGSKGLRYTIKLPLALTLTDTHGTRFGVDEVGAEFWNEVNKSTLGLGSSLLQSMGILSGTSVNRALAVLFKGPKYKKYNLSWILGARNQEESETIRNIVSAINWGLSTDYKNADTPLLFDYPSVFKMGFSYPIYEGSDDGVGREGNNSKWYNFKPAFCEAATFKYLPQGHPVIMNSGYPEAIAISCNFQEIEFWLKRDFNQYSGRAE